MKDVIVIADPGKALDDEEMFILAAYFQRHRFINLVAVVTNLAPSPKRAALAKGTFKALGMPDVPVGIGTAVVRHPVQDDSDFDDIPYLARASELQTGDVLLVESLVAAAPKSITLLLASALTDAAALLTSHESLFVEKVERVVIMGGVNSVFDSHWLDEDGFLTPDTAVNNYYDRPASEFFYRRVQELGMPMTVVSRHPAYAAKLHRHVYDRMFATGHAVGTRLSSFYTQYMSDFWRAVNAPPADPEHDALPPRWNRQLFLESFCEGANALHLTEDDDVSSLLTHAAFSDPMALVACVPLLRDRFFQPQPVTTGGAEHLLIGLSRAHTGLRDADGLRDFMVTGILSGLSA